MNSNKGCIYFFIWSESVGATVKVIYIDKYNILLTALIGFILTVGIFGKQTVVCRIMKQRRSDALGLYVIDIIFRFVFLRRNVLFFKSVVIM